MAWLWASAALMLTTALTHSILGEVRLIGPLLRGRYGVMANDFARTITRAAWHITAVLMAGSAITIVWPGVPVELIRAIGAMWLALGIIDLVWTRGKHVGWPMLSAAGLFALVGAA